MGEKLDDSHQSPNDDEKDVDEQAAGALNDSGSGLDDGILDTSDRRILSPQHNLKPDGFFVRVLKVIFYIPMKILSIFGISLWQNNLQVSGDAKIDKSPLRPASASPIKRKRDDLDESPRLMDDDDEEEEEDGEEGEKKKDMVKILEEAVEGYESGEDKDFKPDDESSCSDEYTEGDTETDISKLSNEDVSEPRPSAYRNMTEIDQDEAKNKQNKQVPDAVSRPTKCIDEPISKKELTPATVGVVG